MPADHSPDSRPYRVTLFFGPEHIEGKPSTSSCVFNVKKRSWKGGIQVAVHVSDEQLATGRSLTGFSRWLADALLPFPAEERAALSERADQLFTQAVCWCKLDVLLESGLPPENQCLTSDTCAAELTDALRRRADFVTSYVAGELDLAPRQTARD